MEYRLKRHDSQYRWLQDVGTPTYSDHVFTGYIGSCTDIHDQRSMKEELEQLVRTRTTELSEALDREKEMNELKSRFVSMASHEFRTPLSVVLSSTVLIEKYLTAQNDERVQKHFMRVKSSVSSLTSILDDFLSLDKLEQGKVDMEVESFDFTEFLSDIVEDMQTIRKNGQQIDISHEGENQLALDRKKLRYILINLAFKFNQVFNRAGRDKRVVIAHPDNDTSGNVLIPAKWSFSLVFLNSRSRPIIHPIPVDTMTDIR